jgi:glycosyltransferase involved in cell wall biosynthesis
MKIAYVTMRFPVPSETFACTDIRALRQAGMNVAVHTLCPPRVDPRRVLVERGLSELPVTQGIPTAHVAGISTCLKRPLLTVRLVAWLLRTSWRRPGQLLLSLGVVPRSMGILVSLEREQPDVVHLFWGHYPSIVGFLVLRALPDVVLSIFLGAYDLTTNYAGSAWVARRADLVSTHARWNFAGIERLGVPVQRIHLAYRGIDLAFFDSTGARKVAHRIVSAGRLEDKKAMDDVLRVFRHVHDRWPDSTLRILGDGPERTKLERLSKALGIDSSVAFLGHVAQSDVVRELAAAEVVLHMSWDETERLPNIVKEAMVSKCACVVTETFGIRELLEDGRHGFVVPPRDVDEAARRVDEIFSGRVHVALFLEEASNRIARLFSVSRSMQSYVDRWHNALMRRRTEHRITVRSPQGASV